MCVLGFFEGADSDFFGDLGYLDEGNATEKGSKNSGGAAFDASGLVCYFFLLSGDFWWFVFL